MTRSHRPCSEPQGCPALPHRSTDRTDRECLPFKGSRRSQRRHKTKRQSCRHRHVPRCFQLEHTFCIKRRACGQVGRAEGRFKGSSALKDLNLFKVSALRAVKQFHPTQQRHPAHALRCHVHAWGPSYGPEVHTKEIGWSPPYKYFPQRI